MQTTRKIAIALSSIAFCSSLIFQLAYGGFSRGVDGKGLMFFKPDEVKPETYCQNPEREDLKELTDRNPLLTVSEWQLVVNPNSSDKYMNKRIVGSVKNNSDKKVSEVRIEFTVFDEEGNQIGIVFDNLYDLKPGGIWKFEIPVTSDVGKAKLKGLYIPEKELKELESTINERGETGTNERSKRPWNGAFQTVFR